MQGETTSTTNATGTAAKSAAPPHHFTGVLFHHEPHQHQPRNINAIHKAEQQEGGLNTRIAIGLTRSVGTMWTAYAFTVLAIIGLLGILGLLNPITILLVGWTSQTLIQLVLLPVIMVGQNVLGRKSELQADEAFKTTMSTYHDIEQIMQHLSAQDAELLRHAKLLIHLLEKNGISLQQLEAEGTTTTHLVDPYAQSPAATNVPAPSAAAGSQEQSAS
ncbi:MAG TPA: hypothetical protein VGT44_18930 [Ktedonobacteraceae bacterium]|nr:hypothetical protein [Ktedonobacteraceae bacterium]